MESDQRTEHAALPPTGGVKVGVNMWIHQFECATATRANSAAAKSLPRPALAPPHDDCNALLTPLV